MPEEIEHEFLLGHFNDNCETRVESIVCCITRNILLYHFQPIFTKPPFKECTKEMAYGLIPMYHVR